MEDNIKLPVHIKYLLNNGALKFIGAPCRVNPNHKGLRFTKNGRKCVECAIVEKDGAEASVVYAWLADEMQRNIEQVSLDRFYRPEKRLDRRKDRSAARKARQDGKRFYYGSRCTECGNNLRFSDTCSCVACEKLWRASMGGGRNCGILMVETHDAEALVEGRFVPVNSMWLDRDVRSNAELLRRATYVGAPCKHCGHTERYTQRGQCVKCVKVRNDKRTTAKPRKMKPAEAALAGSEFDRMFE